MENKYELCKEISKIIRSELGVTKKNVAHSAALNDKYNLSLNYTTKIITGMEDISAYSDFIIYCFTTEYLPNFDLSHYFSEDEIKEYSVSKIEDTKLSFPIKWKMIKIAEDHWIGKTTAREIAQLMNSQFINYNEKTQRTLSYKDGVYSITTNKTAINSIYTALDDGSFIPNTITLNVPEDVEYDYVAGEFIISAGTHLDILDGYHRYLALIKKCELDSKFDYPMELRIVAFSEEKAKQFIYQEDQKTKMKKIDSYSYNQKDYGNQIISMLNQSVLLNDVFSPTGVIDAAIASATINRIYFKGAYRKVVRSEIINIKDKYLKGFEKLLNSSPHILDQRWKKNYIICVFYLLSLDKDIPDLEKDINKLCNAAEESGIIFRTNNVMCQDIARLDKIYKKGV